MTCLTSWAEQGVYRDRVIVNNVGSVIIWDGVSNFTVMDTHPVFWRCENWRHVDWLNDRSIESGTKQGFGERESESEKLNKWERYGEQVAAEGFCLLAGGEWKVWRWEKHKELDDD